MGNIFCRSRSCKALRQKAGSSASTEGKERKEINRAGILAMAEMLRHALAEIDVDAADDVMKKMNEYAFDEEMQGYVNKLGQFVQTLRLEEAERLLVKMVEACRRNDSEKDIIVW